MIDGKNLLLLAIALNIIVADKIEELNERRKVIYVDSCKFLEIVRSINFVSVSHSCEMNVVTFDISMKLL